MTEVEFYHYGVKGMKWGVRRAGSNSSAAGTSSPRRKLTDNQKKMIVAGTAATVIAGAAITAAILYNKKLNATRVADLKNTLEAAYVAKGYNSVRENGGLGSVLDDVLLPKGSVLHRVAGYAEKSVDAPKYASYHPLDVTRYRKSWHTLSAEGEKILYQTRFKTLATSKIAGENTIGKFANELIKESAIPQSKGFRKDIISELVAKGSRSDLEKFDSADLVKTWLTANQGGDWKSPAAQKFFDYMGKHGYVAMTDTVDTGLIAKHATVVINNKLVDTASEVLTKRDREIARAAYQLLKTR